MSMLPSLLHTHLFLTLCNYFKEISGHIKFQIEICYLVMFTLEIRCFCNAFTTVVYCMMMSHHWGQSTSI